MTRAELVRVAGDLIDSDIGQIQRLDPLGIDVLDAHPLTGKGALILEAGVADLGRSTPQSPRDLRDRVHGRAVPLGKLKVDVRPLAGRLVKRNLVNLEVVGIRLVLPAHAEQGGGEEVRSWEFGVRSFGRGVGGIG